VPGAFFTDVCSLHCGNTTVINYQHWNITSTSGARERTSSLSVQVFPKPVVRQNIHEVKIYD
jgi:hypothetical protein